MASQALSLAPYTSEQERLFQRVRALMTRVENRYRRPTRTRLGPEVGRILTRGMPMGATARLWGIPVVVDPALGAHDVAIDSERR